jgi:hypothetical protein
VTPGPGRLGPQIAASIPPGVLGVGRQAAGQGSVGERLDPIDSGTRAPSSPGTDALCSDFQQLRFDVVMR